MALIIKNLTFSFPEIAAPLFNRCSLRFTDNRLHFIRGKNGSGKSTLFRIIRGMIYNGEHIEGTVTIGKTTYLLNDEDHRRELSHTVRLVAQKFDRMIADQFSFTQNLQLATMPHYPHIETFSDDYRIPDLIKRFGINFDVPAGNLSGGQRQILAILMALQKPTSILLLDEPTAALDSKNGGMVMSFIQELLSVNKDLTILIICHDRDLVEQYADKEYYQIKVADDGTRTFSLIPHTK